jgi:hypothetical protein
MYMNVKNSTLVKTTVHVSIIMAPMFATARRVGRDIIAT